MVRRTETDLAWGVYLRGRLHLKPFEPHIQNLFAAKTPALQLGAGPDSLMQAVLDALIEMKVPVPTEDLEQLYRAFPDEVLVLAARAPKTTEQRLRSGSRRARPTLVGSRLETCSRRCGRPVLRSAWYETWM